MIETTIQILLVMLGGVMGFCLHGIISPMREPDVGCIVIKVHKEDDDDKE